MSAIGTRTRQCGAWSAPAPITILPLSGGQNNLQAIVEEFPPATGTLPPDFGIRRATPGYFEAMDIPVVEGRVFTPDDHNRRLPSLIVSNSVKARYWPGTSALGKRIDIGNISARVVGVVRDLHQTSLDEPAEQANR
jgi:putative ABC transport system permease protein